MHRFIQISFFTLIIYYLLHGLDLKEMDFSIFYIYGIVLTLLSIVLGQIVVARRWQKMSRLSFKISFETMVISTMLNVILPAKLGELSKALYLKKFYKFNYNKALSIILIERFFDVVVLFLLICLWVYGYFTDELLKKSIIILSLSLILMVLFFNTKGVLILLKKIPIQFFRVYTQKIYKNINLLFKSSTTIFLYTLLIWFIYFLSNILFFKYAVHFDLSLSNILELFIVSSIAFAVPLAPAGIGAFEGAVVFILTAHGVSKEDALMSASIYHAVLLLVDFILFYPILVTKEIKLKDLIK